MTAEDRAWLERVISSGGRPGIIASEDMRDDTVLLITGLPIRYTVYLDTRQAYFADFSRLFPTADELSWQMAEDLKRRALDRSWAMTINLGQGDVPW